MVMEWSTTADESKRNGVNAIIYGEAGMGKTLLAATAKNALLIASEKGMMSLSPRNIAAIYGADREDISYNMTVLRLDTLAELDTVCTALEEGDDSFTQYRTIFIDSGSHLSDGEVRIMQGFTKDGRQAYQKAADKMLDVIVRLKEIPNMNVIILAHAGTIKDGENLTFAPYFAGNQLPRWMEHEMDGIWCLRQMPDDKGKPTRVLQMQRDMKYSAKTRAASVADFISNPHLDTIFNQILG